MIKVDLSTLVHARPGEREVVVIDLDEFSLDDLEFKFLKGELSFTRVEDGILADGVLHTAIRVECTRCLTPFDQPVTLKLEDIINFPGADRTPERPVRVTGDGWADLSPLIREYAWVNLPVSPVCSPDCQGIPVTGNHPDAESRICHFYSGGNGCCPSMNGMESICVHIIWKA